MRARCVSSVVLTVHVARTAAPGNVLFRAVDSKLPLIRIHTRQREALVGKRIVVTVDSWEPTSRYPSGHYVRTLGDVGDKEVETQVRRWPHTERRDSPCHSLLTMACPLIPPGCAAGARYPYPGVLGSCDGMPAAGQLAHHRGEQQGPA